MTLDGSCKGELRDSWFSRSAKDGNVQHLFTSVCEVCSSRPCGVWGGGGGVTLQLGKIIKKYFYSFKKKQNKKKQDLVFN